MVSLFATAKSAFWLSLQHSVHLRHVASLRLAYLGKGLVHLVHQLLVVLHWLGSLIEVSRPRFFELHLHHNRVSGGSWIDGLVLGDLDVHLVLNVCNDFRLVLKCVADVSLFLALVFHGLFVELDVVRSL